VAPKLEWAVVSVTFAGAFLLWEVRGRAPRAEDIVHAPITLVPTDAHELACALEQQVDRYSCAFVRDEEASGASEANTLIPVLTTDRTPFLIPGLFAEAAIRGHLTTAPPRQRFTADCELKLVKRVDAYGVRFRTGDPWGSAGPAWVAVPVSCHVQ